MNGDMQDRYCPRQWVRRQVFKPAETPVRYKTTPIPTLVRVQQSLQAEPFPGD